MNKILTLILALNTNMLFANFDFGECSSSATFEQQIIHYGGDYENAITVGEIPVGVKGLRIELISDKDIDIRLYGENNDKIVHWPQGILNGPTQATKPYKNINVTYSGYSGENGQRGHEFIEVDGTVPTTLTMKAFGYKSGYATVNYSWTGKENCTPPNSGSGNFQHNIKKNDITLVGQIPKNINNVKINLTSEEDIDIQLFGEDGTAIARWKPAGLMSGANEQNIEYHNMRITWSGYDGTNGNKGDEYINIEGNTTEVLTMKVFGYELGEATVTYSWGEDNNSNLLEKKLFHILNRFSYGANTELLADVNAKGGIDNWLTDQLENQQTDFVEEGTDIAQDKRDNYFAVKQGLQKVFPLIRPLHSKYQVQAVMASFWFNHFNTYGKQLHTEMAKDDDNYFFNALGNFRTLLGISAKSSAMSDYLDGFENTAGHLNENYSREIMELHTLGVENYNQPDGYTHEDIIALARIFTGWSYNKLTGEENLYRYKWKNRKKNSDGSYYFKNFYKNKVFTFQSSKHDNGTKLFLGKSYSNGGINEGEEALNILAYHPNTARFICRKLSHKFVSDTPTQETLDSCIQTFTTHKYSDNQIAKVLENLSQSNEFVSLENYQSKVKDTQEYLLSIARILELDATKVDGNATTGRSDSIGGLLNGHSGQGFWKKEVPTGWGEVSSVWNRIDTTVNRLKTIKLLLSNNKYKKLSLLDFFTSKNLTNSTKVLDFLLPIMTSGFYTQADKEKSQEILCGNTEPCVLRENKLYQLVEYLASSAEFNMQ